MTQWLSFVIFNDEPKSHNLQTYNLWVRLDLTMLCWNLFNDNMIFCGFTSMCSRPRLWQYISPDVMSIAMLEKEHKFYELNFIKVFWKKYSFTYFIRCSTVKSMVSKIFCKQSPLKRSIMIMAKLGVDSIWKDVQKLTQLGKSIIGILFTYLVQPYYIWMFPIQNMRLIEHHLIVDIFWIFHDFYCHGVC